MRRGDSLIRRFGFGLVVLLVFTACGGDSAGDSSQLAVTDNVDVAELLGTPVTEADVQAERMVVHSLIEELTARCMAEAGFEYVPVPFQADGGQPVEVTDTSLGVVDQYFGFYSVDYEPPPQDPNAPIVGSLTDDERASYDQAMQGEAAAFDPRFDSDQSIRDSIADRAANGTGCRFEAQEQALAETERNQVRIDEYQLLRSGMFQTDQRLIRARVDWATCMAEAGYTYRDEPAMRNDLFDQVGVVFEELIAQEVFLEPRQDPPPEAAELIDALRDVEAATAGAHAACRVSIDDAISQVSAKVDELFLERQSG